MGGGAIPALNGHLATVRSFALAMVLVAFAAAAHAAAVQRIAPASGPLAGGNDIVIQGTDLDSVESVAFGLNEVTARHGASRGIELLLTVPAGLAAGTVDVTLFDAARRELLVVRDGYAYYDNGTGAEPKVTSFEPANGPVGGGNMWKILGTDLSQVMRVTFDGVEAAPTGNVEDDSRAFIVPASAVAGAVDVEIIYPSGSLLLDKAYTYASMPVLSSVSPAQGSIAGGTPVTIRGDNLGDTITVDFGPASAAFSVLDSHTVEAIAPPGATSGLTSITITTSTGLTGWFGQCFNYVPSFVSNVSPDNGPVSGGTLVTITGAGLSPITWVMIGANFAAVQPGGTATQVEVIVPGSTVAGNVAIEITTGLGSISAPGGFTYMPATSTPALAPTLTHAIPVAGPLAGGTLVTVFGSNLSGATSVTFGGNPATGLSVISNTSVSALAPAALAAGAVDIAITTPGGVYTLAQGYTYDDTLISSRMTVTSITPNSGPAGTVVTMVGTKLDGVQYVVFGNEGTSVQIISATEIRVTVPAADGLAGSVRVEVGTLTSSVAIPDGFTYTAAADSPNDGNRRDLAGSSSCIQSVGNSRTTAPFMVLLLIGGLAAAYRTRRRA